MEIKDNILRKYLENVYIIGGNACSGKSTISKLIAEKYGFILYQMDEHYGEHRKIADEINQPNMCYPREDIEAFINRPAQEYANSLQSAVKEEVPMVLLDLMLMPKDRPIIADVLFTPEDIKDIIPKERAVFMTSSKELVKQDYFNRPEKRDFYDCVMTFSNPAASFENVFNVVDLINQREAKTIKESGYFTLERTINSKVSNTLAQIEKHLGLCPENKNQVFIRTDRLVIRTFTENDFEQFKELLDMPEHAGWQMQKPRAKEFFQWQISNYEKMDIVKGSVCLGIFDGSTGRIIGQVAAQKHDDLHEPEFGYGILPYARGKGYAKEAALAVLNWIKDNFHIPYIIGTTEINNLASQKVLEYCGFELVDERELLVHITDEQHNFKYYRFKIN